MKRFNHELLLQFRLDENRTQEEFAEEIGIEVSTYKKYESGRVNNPWFKVKRQRRYNVLHLMASRMGLGRPEDLLIEVTSWQNDGSAQAPAPSRGAARHAGSNPENTGRRLESANPLEGDGGPAAEQGGTNGAGGLEAFGTQEPVWTQERLSGGIPLDSRLYVVRVEDNRLDAAIGSRASIVLIKGARQMGKTSLLARGLQAARDAGRDVVLTDLQSLNEVQYASADAFLQALAEVIADQLELDVSPADVWQEHHGPNMNFERFMRREVLQRLHGPSMVWGLDEVDRLADCDFGSEVFGLFRSWHNARSLNPNAPWKNLTLVLAYATEAHRFVKDLNQSPFNVGIGLELDDFTIENVRDLNGRYGTPLDAADELVRYHALVGGHPFLVQCGLHAMAGGRVSIEVLESPDRYEDGPFADHLRHLLVSLSHYPELMDGVRAVLLRTGELTDEIFSRLRSSGVLSGVSRHDAEPRCQLYASYLEKYLV